MKKFILAIAAAFMAASMVSAQDMAQATELYIMEPQPSR